MSRSPDRREEAERRIRSLAGRWREWYPVPVLGAVVLFMLWVRLQAYENFIVGGQVYFNGNDAYYHFREVMYVVTHWPWTMPFDPWTFFPYGTEQGQFGTLFDQIIATAALIVGFGSPSEQLVSKVHLVAPAVFGALVALPVYGIGKRLGGRPTGIFAAVLLALLPGSFLRRTTVGFPDHNSAEPLFQAAAVLAIVVAVQVAEREKPVFEQVLDRDWKGLRPTLGWSLVAGLVAFLYVMVWPPGVFLIGLLGIFLTVALSYDFVRGRSPEHLAFVGTVSMAVVFVLSVVRLDTLVFSTTRVSLLHLLLSLGVGAGSIFMAWLARAWEHRSLPAYGYPATVLVLIAAGATATAVVLPSFFGTVLTNVTRIFAFGQSDTALTVREAQSVFTNVPPDVGPVDAIFQTMLPEYGLLFLTAAIGLVWLVVGIRRNDEYSTADVFVAVWAVATTMMALTQVRFNYYLATVVAVLTAFLLTKVLGVLDLRWIDDVRDVETYQALTVLVVLLVILVPLMPGVVSPGVVRVGQQTGPGNSVVWGGSLDWLEENSPAEGAYGGANNELDYYGTYEQTEDFPYPAGAYGVMSWWDYGHWITVLGHRVPNANPFQQGPVPASAFLQATNETRAELILEALPSMRARPTDLATMTTPELREVVANQGEQEAGEDTRYVVIDDQMAGGKFPAITQWAGPNTSAYFQNGRYRLQGQNVSLPETTQRYDQTMLAELYYQDAAGLSHYRLVHEVDQYSIVGGYIQGQRVSTLTSLSPPGFDWERAGPVASQFQRANRGRQVVSLGQGTGQYAYNARVESRVKVYERVEGATLTGTVPGVQNRTPVVAYVQLQTHTGRNFTYFQQTQTGPDGSFEMTVPYATDDDVSVEEGGTNSSVRANGEYTIQAGTFIAQVASGRAEVPESAVLEGREVQVTLESAQQGNESTASGNETAESLATGPGLAPAEP